LLELIAIRARSINELAGILGVTQQAVMKHLAILERNGIVQQVKVNSKSRVRIVYTTSKPLSLGYIFKNGILCLHIGSGEFSTSRSTDIETLKEMTYTRKMLHMRTKVITNRLRTLVEEDLRMQTEIDSMMKKLGLSPIQTIAFRCFLGMDSNKNLEEASEAFGFNLRDTIKHIV
jgi:predicted transcriptional regulator